MDIANAAAKNEDQGNYFGGKGESSAFVGASINFLETVQAERFNKAINTPRVVADPCGEGALGEINVFIQKIFITLKGIQKYKDVYVDGAINKIASIKPLISKLTSSIASILKGLVQRVRNWVLNKIKSLVSEALNFIMTNFLKQIKDSVIAGIIDQIFCAFEKIVGNLFSLVADFLYSLIGQVINMPICAVEQWTNALINKLINDIDKALEPIFDNIEDVLGGVAKISGSVSSAINTILGFQGFLCNVPKCPELKEFSASPFGGPSASAAANFANFSFDGGFIDQGLKTVNDWMDDFFGEDGNTSQSPGSCYTGLFECGLPQVKIFGGQGSGAIAQAVVNDIGQVIGTNLLSGGKNYESAPFVSFVDPAGCGSNAAGYAEVDNGVIKDIVIVNPGGDYSNVNNGGSPNIEKFIGTPNPIKLYNTLTLEWNVKNADKVSLVGFSNYKNLPSSGSIKFPITDEFAIFDPEADFTTYTFELQASKTNKKSEEQTTAQKFILTINRNDEGDGINVKSPIITKLKATPSKAKVGDVVDISWKTENAEYVKIHSKLEDSETDKLPANNSTLSLVIPDINISKGSTVNQVYTLTATNENAAGDPFEVEQTVKVLVSEADPEDDLIDDGDGDDDVIIVDPIVPGDDDDDDGDDEDDDDDGDDEDDDDDGDDEDDDDDDDEDDGDDDEDEDDGDDDEDEDDGDDDGDDGDDDDDEGASGPGITIVTDVDIISTGIGYTSGDSITVDPDGGGGQGTVLNPVINDIGQVIDITISDGGFGYTRIPSLIINSGTGLGVQLRPRLKFIPLNEFLSDRNLDRRDIDPKDLVRVIDCIT